MAVENLGSITRERISTYEISVFRHVSKLLGDLTNVLIMGEGETTY
jgi:hypothetical protein